jgi:hypothetical protein
MWEFERRVIIKYTIARDIYILYSVYSYIAHTQTIHTSHREEKLKGWVVDCTFTSSVF